jgi:hypothetical protein
MVSHLVADRAGARAEPADAAAAHHDAVGGPGRTEKGVGSDAGDENALDGYTRNLGFRGVDQTIEKASAELSPPAAPSST